MRWALGKADIRIHVAEQILRSRLGVWGDKDILVHSQGIGRKKWFCGRIREKSQGTNIGFEKQRWR